MQRFHQFDDDEDFGHVDGDASGDVVEWRPGMVASSPAPPWHMWGNSVDVSLPPAAAAPTPTLIQQVVKINYGRPETWRFLLFARIKSAPGTTPPDIANVNVFWVITVGVGRTALILGFTTMSFRWVGDFIEAQKWTTSITTQPLLDTVATSTQQVDLIPGESINVEARLQHFASSALPSPVLVEVGALLTPNVHVRPDWYINGPPEVVFPGGETGGR